MKIPEKIEKNIRKLTGSMKENRRILLILLSLVIIVLILTVYIWQAKIDEEIRSAKLQVFNETTDYPVGEIVGDLVIRQTFTYAGEFEGIALRFATYERVNEGYINVSVKDKTSGRDIYTNRLNTKEIVDNDFHSIIFDDTCGGEASAEYEIIISTDNTDLEQAITVWCSFEDVIPEGTLSIAGIPQQGDINYGLIKRGSQELVVAYGFLVVLLGISLILVFACVYIFKAKIEVIFLVCAVLFGLGYTLILSPGAIPDEHFHMDMAYRYSNKFLNTSRVEDEEILFRKVDAENWIVTEHPDSEHYQKLLDSTLFDTEYEDESVVGPAQKASVYSFLYLPSALGITLARVIDLGTIPMLYMGRLFNFAFFLLCVYFAIRITPVGKNIYFMTAMFPMAMHLAFSFSYDSIIIGGLFFLSALYLRAIYSDREFGNFDKLILIALSALLVPAKAIYVFVLCLAFLIPKSKFASTKRKALFIALLFGVSLLLFAVVNLSIISFSVAGQAEPGQVAEHFSLTYVIGHPDRILKIFINTMVLQSEFYFTSLVGRSLGWLDLNIPTPLVLLSFALFMVACFTDTREVTFDQKKNSIQRLVFFTVFTSVVLLSMFVMLLSWTPLENKVIEGVQGRYFLPVLPLVGLCIYNKHIKIDEGILKHVYMSVGIIHFFALYSLLR